MRTLEALSLKGKRVLVRCDLNVPLDGSRITDDARIVHTIPTIKRLLGLGAKQLVLCSHLGRPKGEAQPEFSLKPVQAHLAKLLGEEVAFVEDVIEGALPATRIVLLENLRFYPGEKENDPAFAKALASRGECFVNDAFATAHRAHASVVGVCEHLRAAPGLLMQRELAYLDLKKLEHPLFGIFGAAKIADKLPLLRAFLTNADQVLLGGAIVFTFMKAQGYSVGKSLIDRESLATAAEISEESGELMLFPRDFVCAERPESGVATMVAEFHKIPAEQMGLDLGPKSVTLFTKRLAEAKTIVWNGPLGVAEVDEFAEATRKVAEFITSLPGVTTIAGGGDTAAALHRLNLAGRFTHVSTGGGASLKLLAGEPLPAIDALEENVERFAD